MLLVFALTAPPLVLVTVGFLRVFDRRGLASIGARWPEGPEGGARAALRQAAAVPLAVLAFLGAWLLALKLVPGTAVHVEGWSGEMAGPAGALHLALLLAGFLVQGGVEEWLVRGYIYHALRQRWRRSIAVLSSALLFAALHGLNPDVSPVALLNTFLVGVILTFLVERSGSLWSATLAHGVWNFAISSLISLPVSGVPPPPPARAFRGWPRAADRRRLRAGREPAPLSSGGRGGPGARPRAAGEQRCHSLRTFGGSSPSGRGVVHPLLRPFEQPLFRKEPG